MNTYHAEVLADSISPDGVRLTTLKVTFPRFILAEVNTHRMLSRNSASSRAIPTEKLIERVRTAPFIPETFNKRVKGMGVGEALNDSHTQSARAAWLRAASNAASEASILAELDVDKSRANRLLEPFLWHTAIISATEWDNFFALRDHPAAQPEFQITARLMREAMADSQPQPLDYNMWHLPMLTEDELAALCADRRDTDAVSDDELDEIIEHWKLVSAGRLARVSFDTHEDFEPVERSVERARMLMGNGHFSPFEHVARPMDDADQMLGLCMATSDDTDWWLTFSGNFRGWVQMRKEIPYESNFGLVDAA